MTDMHDARRTAEALILAVHRNDAQAATDLWNMLGEQERFALALATADAALESLRLALPGYDADRLANYLTFSAAILAQTPARDAQ